MLIYKKADREATSWNITTVDSRFEHHVGTKVFEVSPGKFAVASHGWKDSIYVHLWMQDG